MPNGAVIPAVVSSPFLERRRRGNVERATIDDALRLLEHGDCVSGSKAAAGRHRVHDPDDDGEPERSADWGLTPKPTPEPFI